MNNSWSTSLPSINMSIVNDLEGPQRPKTLSPSKITPGLSRPYVGNFLPEQVNVPKIFKPSINPFPDFNPNPSLIKFSSLEDDALNLALHTLGISSAEFNSMSKSDLRSRYASGIPNAYAINILLNIKEKTENEITPRINLINQTTPITPSNSVTNFTARSRSQISPSNYESKTMFNKKISSKPSGSDELDYFVCSHGLNGLNDNR